MQRDTLLISSAPYLLNPPLMFGTGHAFTERRNARLRSPGSHDHQHNPADQGQSPGNRRQRNGPLFVDRGLEGTQVDHVFAGRIGDAVVGEYHEAEHDERDAENRCCFHGPVPVMSLHVGQYSLLLARDASP